MGLGFLVMLATFALTRSSIGFGMIWLLIPAFLFLGKGIGEIITAISAARAARQVAMPPATHRTNELSPHPIYDTVAPPSVTENTTRHLEADTPSQSRETT